MKNKLWFLLLCGLLAGGCSIPNEMKYLQNRQFTSTTPLGLYLQIVMAGKKKIGGELIAVTPDTILLLTDLPPRLKRVAKTEVLRYYLYTDKPITNYQNSLITRSVFGFASTLLLLSDEPGIQIGGATLAVLTGLNLLKHEYLFNNRQLPYSQLHWYARFPQGLNKTIDLKTLF